MLTFYVTNLLFVNIADENEYTMSIMRHLFRYISNRNTDRNMQKTGLSL